MSRREALARVAWLTGGAIIGAEFFLNGSRALARATGPGFTPDERALLDEIAETIIPTTATPGARAARVGGFMAMMVDDCYDDAHQEIFRAGLIRIDANCRQSHGKSFLSASPAERSAVLTRIDAEVAAQAGPRPHGAPAHFFRLMKQLTLLGYFTSEIGCSQALRYLEVPGAFHGDVPYAKGDRAWFGRTSTALF
jgi:hypothetical protein